MTLVERCIYNLGSGDNPYLVRVKVNGRNVTGARPTLKAARVLRAELEAQRARGSALDPHLGRITFQEFAEEWCAGREKLNVANTNARMESAFRLHVYPLIGNRRLAAIKPMHIEAMITSMLRTPLAHSTTRVIFYNVASVFKAAVRNDYLTKSPCTGVRLGRPPESEKVQPLEGEHVGIIGESMMDHLRGAVLFAAATGLRPGELFGLTLDRKHIDFQRRILRVKQQIQTPRNGGGVYLCPPKTPASDREIPLSDLAIGILNTHLQTHGTHTFEIPWGDPPAPGDLDKRNIIKADLVFAAHTFRDPARRREGRTWAPMRRRQMGFAWETATEGYAFPDASGWHALRHFHASLLIEGGESIIVVQNRLGHTSAKITLDTYGHLFKDNFDKSRGIVDAGLKAILGGRVLRAVNG